MYEILHVIKTLVFITNLHSAVLINQMEMKAELFKGIEISIEADDNTVASIVVSVKF